MASIQEYLKQQAKNIQETIGETASQEAENVIKPSWYDLQQSAKAFLIAAKYKENIINQLKQSSIKHILTMKELSNQYQIKKFNTDLFKGVTFTQNFYEKLFVFDKLLTKYFNDLPKRGIIVMIDNEGSPSTYEIPLESMSEIARKNGRLYGYDPGKNKSIEDQVDKKYKGDLKHINQGRAAFMGVNARLEVFYSRRARYIKTNEDTGESRVREYQRQGGLLMWKSNGEWEIASVANQGVVSEAYVQFLFTRHRTAKDKLYGISSGEGKYYSHALIENFYKYYMSGVTSLAAIVEEDVIGEWAQYAIKKENAALASSEQYIAVATTILASTNEFTPTELKEMIKNAFKNNTHLAPLIKGKIKDEAVKKMKSIDLLKNTKEKLQSKGWIAVDVETADDLITATQKAIIENL